MPSAFRPGSFLDRITGKEQRSVPLPDHNLYGALGRPHSFKPHLSLESYGDNAYLYSSVNVIAFELARTEFRLQKRNPKGEIEPVERHQAIETMNRPQVTSGGKSMLTKMLLKMVTGMHLLLNGEGFWYLTRRMPGVLGGAPRRIDLLLPERVHTVTDKDTGDLVEYVYRLNDRELHIDPMDVVHFRLPDPSAWERGHAPTESIRYAIDTHKEADILNLRRIQNNAVPPIALTMKGTPSKPALDNMRSTWQQRYGGADNAGKPAILPEGTDIKQLQQTNAEMQYIEGKGVNVKEILANFRVGPEMLGQTDSQTRANAEAAIFVFQRFGMLPLITLFADTLTNDYLPAFPGTSDSKGQWHMEYGFDDPVPENTEEKRQNARTLWDMGALPPDEAREMFGKEALGLEGMDTPYLDMGKWPVGEKPEPEQAENNLGAEEL